MLFQSMFMVSLIGTITSNNLRDRRDGDRIVTGFTTIYVISAYHP